MKSKLKYLTAAVASVGVMASANAALVLDGPYVAYGDGQSYSLPVLGIIYEFEQSGTLTNSIQPSNPYYITSTPGAIKDLTVIGTGSSGQPVTTNFEGMDNAYPTPNSDGITFFSTGTTLDPGGINEFNGDVADTWDVRLTAFNTFLDGEAPVFLFNNNQTNSGDAIDQSLAVWAALTLYDDDGLLQPKTFYFTNEGGVYALVSEGGGGVLNGPVGMGTLGDPVGPLAGTNEATDYVLSGGALCYTATLNIVSCTSDDAVGGPINHNLGANQAVYAVVFPGLDAILGTAGFGGYDVLSIDWRMGCDPLTTFVQDPDGQTGDNLNCIGRSLNNGYEQLFITTRAIDITEVPEPATLALLGLGLLGLGAMRRRKA